MCSARLGHEKPDSRAYAAVTSASGVPLWYVGDGLVNDVIGPLVHGAGRAVRYDRYGLDGDLGRLDKVDRWGDVVRLLTRGGGS